jgi:hypothetical protein
MSSRSTSLPAPRTLSSRNPSLASADTGLVWELLPLPMDRDVTFLPEETPDLASGESRSAGRISSVDAGEWDLLQESRCCLEFGQLKERAEPDELLWPEICRTEIGHGRLFGHRLRSFAALSRAGVERLLPIARTVS